MIDLNDLIQIGYLSKPYGVQGEIVLRIIEEHENADWETEFLFLLIDGLPVPYYVEEINERHGGEFVVKLERIETNEKAKTFCGLAAYIEKADYNESEDSGVSEFVGFKAFDIEKGAIGVITEILDNKKNPLFAIAFEGKEILIPMNERLIQSVNPRKKEITFKTPDGLIDLYLYGIEDDE